jgi:glycosyltransferase involved in cell wall biosynthesis
LDSVTVANPLSEPEHKTNSKPKKLLFFISEDSTFCTHRINLAKQAIKAGYQVAIATRCNQYQALIEASGIQVFPLKKSKRASVNPWLQIQSLLELNRIYAEYKPDISHHVAIKPVFLGSIIARVNKVPIVINALGGLGYIFTSSNETKFLKKVKKYLLRRSALLFFHWIFSNPNSKLILQNPDDITTLVSSGCIKTDKITLIRGAGVDINAFAAKPPLPRQPDQLDQQHLKQPIIISCVSRLLWDKGIGELVDAAKIIKAKGVSAKIILYGEPDLENPTSIPLATIQSWHENQIIEWQGHCTDVAKAYAECHIAVLPSYREGLPKTLLEAASTARPIVTTDVPGCKEVVVHQENGLLVPVKNAGALAEALILLCEDAELRQRMGEAGRKRVEQYFADTLIHQQTLDLYAKY